MKTIRKITSVFALFALGIFMLSAQSCKESSDEKAGSKKHKKEWTEEDKEKFRIKQREGIKTKLDLTDEQTSQFEAIREKYKPQFEAIEKERREERKQVMERMKEEITSVLTEEQNQKYAEMNKKSDKYGKHGRSSHHKKGQENKGKK